MLAAIPRGHHAGDRAGAEERRVHEVQARGHRRLAEVEAGRAVWELTPGEQHYNPIGTVHGGFAATLLDSALGCAVHTTMPVGRAYTTLEFKVNLVRGLNDRVPLVRAIGRVVHRGRQVSTAEAELVGHDGKLYAHASTTCLVFDLPT